MTSCASVWGIADAYMTLRGSGYTWSYGVAEHHDVVLRWYEAFTKSPVTHASPVCLGCVRTGSVST